MSHQLATLRLTTGELWVILNELNEGAGILGAEQAMSEVAAPEDRALLSDGRARLRARGLLRPAGEGRATVAEGVRHIIRRSASPAAALWLLRLDGQPPPAQIYVALDAEGGVAYRPDAAGFHDFIPVPDVAALTVLAHAAMGAGLADDVARPRAWLVPTAVLGPITESGERDTDDLANRHALVGCGMSSSDAAAFVAAVAEATQRGALTGFLVGKAGVSLTWLAHAGAVWTVRLDGDSGLSLLRRCATEAARQQVAALAGEVATRVWGPDRTSAAE